MASGPGPGSRVPAGVPSVIVPERNEESYVGDSPDGPLIPDE